MPIPTGLTDIRIRRASREDNDRKSEAAHRRDWSRMLDYMDAIEFQFEGASVRLPVTKAALSRFLDELRSIENTGTQVTRHRRQEGDFQGLAEAIESTPLPRRAPERRRRTPVEAAVPVEHIPLTAWARLLEEG